MTEKCRNGHVRTEGNTSWVKRSDRPGMRRRCLDCKRTNKATAPELSAKRLRERLEDIEDLISYGSTFNEVIDRSAYKHWGTMQEALRRADRHDLLDAMRLKLAEGAVNIDTPKAARGKVCKNRVCGRKHYAKGYCRKHYEKIRRRGSLAPLPVIVRLCSLDDCNGKHRALGFCQKHRRRFERHGDPYMTIRKEAA